MLSPHRINLSNPKRGARYTKTMNILITLALRGIPINNDFIVINHRKYKPERCESGLISTLGKRV